MCLARQMACCRACIPHGDQFVELLRKVSFHTLTELLLPPFAEAFERLAMGGGLQKLAMYAPHLLIPLANVLALLLEHSVGPVEIEEQIHACLYVERLTCHSALFVRCDLLRQPFQMIYGSLPSLHGAEARNLDRLLVANPLLQHGVQAKHKAFHCARLSSASVVSDHALTSFVAWRR